MIELFSKKTLIRRTGKLKKIFSKGNLLDLTEWVAKPDGLTQHWVLSKGINLISGDIIMISFVGGDLSGGTRYFIGDPSYRFALFGSNSLDNVFDGFGVKAYLNNVELNLESDQVPLNGIHTLKIEVTRDGVLTNIGARDDSARTKLALFNFIHQRAGTIMHEISLTNKSEGATQSPTIGDVSATMANFTVAIWKDKYKL